MAGAGTYLGAHLCLDVWRTFFVNEKADILLSRQTDHDTEPVSLRCVEQCTGWHGVRNAHRVQTACRHLSEVALNNFQVVVFVPSLIGSKCSVCDAADPQLLVPDVQKLPMRLWPLYANICWHSR